MTASVRTLGTLANGLLLQREAAERARSHRGNDRVVQPQPACSAIVTRHAVPAGSALVAADIVARRGGRLRGGGFCRGGALRGGPAARTPGPAGGPPAGKGAWRPPPKREPR